MVKAALSSVIRRLVSAQTRSGPPDRHLLERFLAHQGEDAFAALVERHGPMVLAVARSVLHHRQDAEDVFQATFLVLARRAGSVRKRGSIGSWLHGVAYRLALKARTAAAARQRRESSAPARAAEESLDDLTWRELRQILHEELERLPERYRAPLVLCYLEGMMQDQAAEHLGLAKGTLKGRLERGRLLLRGRLSRRGLAPAVVLLADTTGLVKAALPGPLVSTTAQTAAALAAGRAASVSAGVVQLTEGVLRAMFKAQLRSAAAVLLLALGLVAAATAVLAARGVPAQPPAPARAAGPGPSAEASAKPGADTGKPIRSLPGHKDRLTTVAYSPNGRWIGTASWDGTARLWDARTGKEVRRLDVPASRNYKPARLCRILFSPDNEYVVVAQQAMPDEPGVMVWKRQTGEKVRQVPAGMGSVAVSPDGRLIACGGYAIIGLYELASGKAVREIRSQQTHIESLTFSPDSNTLLATGPLPRPPRADGLQRLGSMPPVTRVWDVATGKERRSPLHDLELGGPTFSPDGRTLAVGSALLEMATGRVRATLTGHAALAVDGVAFSPDGRTLASAGVDGTVRVWDLLSGKELRRFGKAIDPSRGGWVLAVAFSPDGRTLVSGGMDKKAHVWDVSRITGRRRAVAERSPADLEADWKDLAGDAAAGYTALGRLVAARGSAVAFLGKRLRSIKPVDPKRIARLLADLDSDRFVVREQATRELKALAEHAVPALRKALAGKPSLESRRRLEALLDRLDSANLSAETVRQIRAVEALECVGNPEARRLLAQLAAGPPTMHLTREAQASMGRLARRPRPAP
jgi:RNA polymerase sigma factor (sigma-70 family)